jgi:hypothetical protein
MLSTAEFRAEAKKAFADAKAYRIDARLSKGERRKLLSKWADQRQADAEFYLSRAQINEDFERRHAPKQEAA